MEIWDDEAAGDPEMVRRAAAILEAYVGKSSLVALGDGRARRPSTRPSAPCRARKRSRCWAWRADADEAAIRAAHKRLLAARPSRPQRLGLSRQEGPAGTRHASGAVARVAETAAPRNRAAKR